MHFKKIMVEDITSLVVLFVPKLAFAEVALHNHD